MTLKWNQMAKRISFTASTDRLYRLFFAYSGLRSTTTDLGGGTIIHSWIPKTHKPSKPTLLLIHGFGANTMWQYGDLLRHLLPHYNLYVPDLLFFGQSHTSAPDRSEAFQAKCLMKLMDVHGVAGKVSLVGISYGGFVGYSMAAQFPASVERVVVCCTGVCLEERDMGEGLFAVADLEEAARILLPQTVEKLRELMKLSFVRPVGGVPSFILSDFIRVMCTDHLKEKRELIQEILKGRKLSNLPKINQQTLIIWGEQDQIFPVELGHRLKRHIRGNAELVIIKNAGHAVNLEKPKEFTRHLKAFLLDSPTAK